MGLVVILAALLFLLVVAIFWFVYVWRHPPICELCGQEADVWERGRVLCQGCSDRLRYMTGRLIEGGVTRHEVAEVLRRIEEQERSEGR